MCSNGDGSLTIAAACDTLYGELNAAAPDPANPSGPPRMTCTTLIAYNSGTGQVYERCQSTIDLGSAGVCIAKGAVPGSAESVVDTVCYYAQYQESDADVIADPNIMPAECKNQVLTCSCNDRGAVGTEVARLNDVQHQQLAVQYSVDLPWVPVAFDASCYAERE